MSKKIEFKLNGQPCSAQPGESILAAAGRAGVELPNLCHHPDFCVKANCRVCVVEVKGRNSLAPSCATLVEEGMEVETASERVIQARRANLELIYAEHVEKCPTCLWRYECKLLHYAALWKLKISRHPDRKGKRQIYHFANAVELDSSQCIDCRNCLDACAMQNIHYLELSGKGHDQDIHPTANPERHCILCGQCALHCPVSSAQEQAEWSEVEKLIEDDDSIVVAQFAPSVRVSIGESFGLAPGADVQAKLISALRALGFDYVFDVNTAADITTLAEANELIERLQEKKHLPMFTSCCPGWVNFVEHYYPDLIPLLTTVRSPQIHGGAAIKTYWAEKVGADPSKIKVVSIMPCTAKKHEASRPELSIKGMPAVDHVLTVRELAFLFKKKRIDLATMTAAEADAPLANFSGGAAIFGASGGVMESALRAAQFVLADGNQTSLADQRLEFKELHGTEGVKVAEVPIAGRILRVAVVNGIAHAREMIYRLSEFDYVEVMACPGGCIGGGGMPIPTTNEIRQKRSAGLRKIDKGRPIRRSNDNQEAKAVMDWWNKYDLSKEALYSSFSAKKNFKKIK